MLLHRTIYIIYIYIYIIYIRYTATHIAQLSVDLVAIYTVPKVIDFSRYITKCSEENEILCGIFCAVSGFPLHFVLYLGNLYYFLVSVGSVQV